ncbi:hypothetical protein [Streptomyces ochraceiscleroticus]|uniref:hypothetical protein n=1 Tax=Streptomyces ochraceiscleroticus TaxID=47761 RepID=UPI0012FEA6BB|nr:hypothetical protein [Streptomyces ochraceiscleroticus]
MFILTAALVGLGLIARKRNKSLMPIAFIIAAIMAYQGFSALQDADRYSWNEDEVRTAIGRASADLESEPHVDDAGDYSALIAEALKTAADDDGPWQDLDVSSADPGDADGAGVGYDEENEGAGNYDIATDEGEYAHCMTVKQKISDSGSVFVPGGTSIVQYDLSIKTADGPC